MLNDEDRNAKIEAAIIETGVNGKTVFEIGTGAGLTAMLFARHGAKKVVTCEMDAQLYMVAMAIIDSNGLQDKIQIINKSSTQAIDDGDIDFHPDIIFTETLDCGIVGEGFYLVRDDIRRVSRNDTIVIPQMVSQFGSLTQCEELYDLNHVDTHCGFNMDLLNTYSTKNYYPIRPSLYNPKALTDVKLVNVYKYKEDVNRGSTVEFVPTIDGLCHGLLTFFEAQFGTRLVTNDLRKRSHWHQAFHPLKRPIRLIANNAYKFRLAPHGNFKALEI
jgi:type II protein arginine methyltransferase